MLESADRDFAIVLRVPAYAIFRVSPEALFYVVAPVHGVSGNRGGAAIGFHWAGCEGADQVQGEGTAELLDDRSIEVEFAYHNGDEAVLKRAAASGRDGTTVRTLRECRPSG